MPTVETRQTRAGTRYFVRVRDPRRGGKFTSRTFATRPEAEGFRRDVDARGPAWALEQQDLADEQSDALTLDDWAAIHFGSMTRASPGTVERYRRIYARVWSPLLGPMPLTAIGRPEVAAALLAVPGMDKTVRNAWGVLTSMMKTAVLDGRLQRSPCLGVQLPRRSDHEETEHRYLSQAEWWGLLDATPVHWQPLLAMLAAAVIAGTSTMLLWLLAAVAFGAFFAALLGALDDALKVLRAQVVIGQQPIMRGLQRERHDRQQHADQ